MNAHQTGRLISLVLALLSGANSDTQYLTIPRTAMPIIFGAQLQPGPVVLCSVDAQPMFQLFVLLSVDGLSLAEASMAISAEMTKCVVGR